MAITYGTLDDHITLLGDKGYLGPEFKPGGTIGYWVRQLEEQFEEARFNAIGEGKVKGFFISATGEFNERLDRAQFTFFYKYDPSDNTLSMSSLIVRLGKKTPMRFELSDSGKLPTAIDAYNSVNLKATLPKKPDTLLERLKSNLDKQKSFDDLQMDPTQNVWHPRR